MRLVKCYIENFGLLHAESLSFDKGLNCCCTDNGTGKTTLAAFIEAMLYGIGDTRKQSLDENPRKKYSPWQGGRFGGSLTIEVGNRRYSIERTFGQKAADDTFRLVDADSGNVSDDFGENVGEALFGIDREGFLRTVFLSEKNLQGKNDNRSISAKLSDLVGVDGDVGGFDEALKLLEERRKFYYKKGNTGEIANLKERINECDRRIDGIARFEADAAQKKEKLAQLSAERTELAEREKQARLKLDSIIKNRERSSNEERYAAMLADIEVEKEKLARAKKFFGDRIPTATEIDSARDAYVEADRLRMEAMAERGNEEYVALSEFFKRPTDFAEIADAERYAELIEEKNRELTAIENRTDRISKEMEAIFPERAPSPDEIVAAQKAKRGKITPKKIFFLLFGIGVGAVGAILGGSYGYVAAGAGLVLALISLFMMTKAKESKEFLSFIRKYNGCECSGGKNAIDEIKAKAARYNELSRALTERRDELCDEKNDLSLKVYAFLGKFPLTDADSMLGSVHVIKHRFTKYYALSQMGMHEESSKLAKLQKSEYLAKAAAEFLAKFPTVTAAPFSEIRDNLNSYNYILASIERLERDRDLFAAKHGVTGKVGIALTDTEASVNAELVEIADRAKALSAEYAILDRELRAALAEIEKKDEYVGDREELTERYNKYVDNLEVIRKTSLYLKEACDNITSKYLGKTKAGFEEYSRLIAGTDGDYTLNTSFEISKNERGESRAIESYSRGTKDLYALGLRLALVDALYEKESPFIILDDPFIALDDAKLERAKATLKELGRTRQILYFTCAKSREIS